jgi:hypothetical protein
MRWQPTATTLRLSAAAASSSDTPSLVEPSLFTFGTEKATITQFTHNSSTLDSRLETTQQCLSVFTVSQSHKGQWHTPQNHPIELKTGLRTQFITNQKSQQWLDLGPYPSSGIRFTYSTHSTFEVSNATIRLQFGS